MSWEWSPRRPPRIGVAYTAHGPKPMRVVTEEMQAGPFSAQYGVFRVDPERGLYVQYEGTWAGEPWFDDEGRKWQGKRYLGVATVITSCDFTPYLWYGPDAFATVQLFDDNLWGGGA